MKLSVLLPAIALSFMGLALVSCNNSSSSHSPSEPSITARFSEPEKPDSPVSAPWRISLSSEAEEISALLDKGSYNAADTLFSNYIPRKPNDGGIYCQYVRFLIENYDFSPSGFISTPIRTDDKYLVWAVVDQAIKLAIEFEQNPNHI